MTSQICHFSRYFYISASQTRSSQFSAIILKIHPSRKKLPIFFSFPYSIHFLHISRLILYTLPDIYFSCHLIYTVFYISVSSHMLSPIFGIPFFYFQAENAHHLRFNSSITSSGQFSLSLARDALLFTPNAACIHLSQHLLHGTVFASYLSSPLEYNHSGQLPGLLSFISTNQCGV